MESINASDFKARCLAILDRVSATGERIVTLKRGQPVAELCPAEEYDTVRVISLDPEPGTEAPSPTLLGNSVGEWEGDTLVVTTTGIDYPWFRQTGIPQSPAIEVAERYTVNDAGSMLEMVLTATDPETFVGPAVLTKSWTWRPGLEVLPFQCAEE